METETIALCGSAKFEKEFKEENKRLTLQGHIVYSLSCYPSDFGGKNWYTDDEKIMLDVVHLGKIINSDRVHVINVGGYIGESTKREIAFAKMIGRRVTYKEPVPASTLNKDVYDRLGT